MKTKKQKYYCAIVGDINRSRDLTPTERAKVQMKFIKAIAMLNEEFKSSIVAPFRIREGDSFEGILSKSAESYRFVRQLQDIMDSVVFSFGIGIDSLSTKIGKNIDVIDGNAFYRARKALETAKKKKQEVVFDFDSPACILINALIGLIEKEWKRLTDRQREIIQLMKVHENQEVVAKKLKITQPAVSDVWRSPTIRGLNEAEEAMHDFLDKIVIEYSYKR